MKFFSILAVSCLTLSLSSSIAYSGEDLGYTNKAYEIIWQFDYNESEAEAVEVAKLQDLIKLNHKGWSVQISKEFHPSLVNYPLTADENLAEIVVNKLKGCRSFDEECQRVIGNLNRRKLAETTLADIKRDGGISLPAQSTQYSIKVFAESHYREKTEGKKTIARMSKYLAKVLKPLEERALGRTSSICMGGECWSYEKIVE